MVNDTPGYEQTRVKYLETESSWYNFTDPDSKQKNDDKWLSASGDKMRCVKNKMYLWIFLKGLNPQMQYIILIFKTNKYIFDNLDWYLPSYVLL